MTSERDVERVLGEQCRKVRRMAGELIAAGSDPFDVAQVVRDHGQWFDTLADDLLDGLKPSSKTR